MSVISDRRSVPPVRHRRRIGLPAALLLLSAFFGCHAKTESTRQEVVFWHFWGGGDRTVVEDVVARFNRSQSKYFVRAVAMPGNNLDLKLFLAVTGGDPPDLVNQDDPIVADWAARGALLGLDEVATDQELAELEEWLLPAAKQLGKYSGQRYALANGIDIRALYFNATLLDAHGLAPPTTIAELNDAARVTTVRDAEGKPLRFGFLPDPRRLWAWGIVFGGTFYAADQQRVVANSEPVVAALEWMTSFRQEYGADEVASFRQGDQSLPGKTFPLLAERYALIMDGQWRVRDIRAAQQAQRERGEPVTRYGVCPLPAPPSGRSRAGWVNGNFFLIPRGARQAPGAWEFMKFWCGLAGNAPAAAETCIAGGWIPVSEQVVQEPRFQQHLASEPLFAQFVQLAASPHQVPTPIIPGAGYFQRTINLAAETSMWVKTAPPPRELLDRATVDVQSHLDAIQEDLRARKVLFPASKAPRSSHLSRATDSR